MSEFEKMISGELYFSADSELERMRREAKILTEEFNRTSVVQRELRVELLQKLFGSTGDSIYIEPDFHCDYGRNIYVGDNFYANFGCVILDVAEVRIGKNCFIAPQVGIYTATHPLMPDERISGYELGKPITIGDNCWLGGHSTILPNVTLGNNVVVGAGAVVTRSFGDNVVIAGNPARVIKELEI